MRVLFINPAHRDQNIWTYDRMSEALGAKFFTPPLGLLTVAALLPKSWDIRLVDRNFANITSEDLRNADVVLTGGMLTQRTDTLEIISLSQRHGVQVVVGGFDASASQAIYSSADVIVVGEAETCIDELINAILTRVRGRILGSTGQRADMSRTRAPRYDLIDLADYLAPGIQFSRGCPYTCEFCDIIEIYGRQPRTKTWAQIEPELDALYDRGHRGLVFVVDDNLIGNRGLLRGVLAGLIAWQKRKRFPFEFYSSSTINVANDPDLLNLLRAANFTTLFVGIESTDLETLRLARKKQNTQMDQLGAIHTIHKAGLFVTAGFVLGFDGEPPSAASDILAFIEAASLPIAGTSLLVALPETQLWRRLEKEGRLRASDAWAQQLLRPLNFEPRRPRSAILEDYAHALEGTYATDSYFRRLRRQLATVPPTRLPRRPGLRHRLRNMKRLIRLLTVLRREPALWREFWRTVWFCVRHSPWHLRAGVAISAAFLDYGPSALRIAAEARTAARATGETAAA